MKACKSNQISSSSLDFLLSKSVQHEPKVGAKQEKKLQNIGKQNVQKITLYGLQKFGKSQIAKQQNDIKIKKKQKKRHSQMICSQKFSTCPQEYQFIFRKSSQIKLSHEPKDKQAPHECCIDFRPFIKTYSLQKIKNIQKLSKKQLLQDKIQKLKKQKQQNQQGIKPNLKKGYKQKPQKEEKKEKDKKNIISKIFSSIPKYTKNQKGTYGFQLQDARYEPEERMQKKAAFQYNLKKLLSQARWSQQNNAQAKLNSLQKKQPKAKNQKAQIFIEQPFINKTYCHVCYAHFGNYYQHIKSNTHIKKVRKSPGNTYIKQLSERYLQERRKNEKQNYSQNLNINSSQSHHNQKERQRQKIYMKRTIRLVFCLKIHQNEIHQTFYIKKKQFFQIIQQADRKQLLQYELQSTSRYLNENEIANKQYFQKNNLKRTAVRINIFMVTSQVSLIVNRNQCQHKQALLFEGQFLRINTFQFKIICSRRIQLILREKQFQHYDTQFTIMNTCKKFKATQIQKDEVKSIVVIKLITKNLNTKDKTTIKKKKNIKIQKQDLIQELGLGCKLRRSERLKANRMQKSNKRKEKYGKQQNKIGQGQQLKIINKQ